ncbi:hypothetical protein HELRODRAFT_171417 [Helobdella robusta]|uniref:DUF753 domain-containing protein n=1 Tax=Helobdella robusta TaxID=6412 RepID=T1F491_HELRO|nr:hypothetical protein HELRODRAFT_171417 [Helobdella robusta]ESO05749.1 hypothetical protein HELRODRAFT_171417 [Helobdella robusta]
MKICPNVFEGINCRVCYAMSDASNDPCFQPNNSASQQCDSGKTFCYIDLRNNAAGKKIVRGCSDAAFNKFAPVEENSIYAAIKSCTSDGCNAGAVREYFQDIEIASGLSRNELDNKLLN